MDNKHDTLTDGQVPVFSGDLQTDRQGLEGLGNSQMGRVIKLIRPMKQGLNNPMLVQQLPLSYYKYNGGSSVMAPGRPFWMIDILKAEISISWKGLSQLSLGHSSGAEQKR